MSAISRAVGRMVGEPIAILDKKIRDSQINRFSDRTQNLTKNELAELSTFIAENQAIIQAAKELPRPEFTNKVERFHRTAPMIRFLTQETTHSAIHQRLAQMDHMNQGTINLGKEVRLIPNFKDLNYGIGLLAPSIAGEVLSIEEKIQILEDKQRKHLEGFLDVRENGDFVITENTPGVQLHCALVGLRDYILNHSDEIKELQNLRKNNPAEYQRIVNENPDIKEIIDFLTGSVDDSFTLRTENELQLAREEARKQFDASFEANSFDVQGQHRAFKTYQDSIHVIETAQYAIDLARDPGAVKAPEVRILEEYTQTKASLEEYTQFIEPYFIKRGVSEASKAYLAFAKAQWKADYARVDEIRIRISDHVKDDIVIQTPMGKEKEKQALEAKEKARESSIRADNSPDRSISEGSETIAESSGNSDKEKTESPDRSSEKSEASDQELPMTLDTETMPAEDVFHTIYAALKNPINHGSKEKALTDLQITELFLASTQAAEDKTQFFCMDQKIYSPIIGEGNVCSVKLLIDTQKEMVTRESTSKSAYPHPEAVNEEGMPLPFIRNTGDIKITNTFFYRTGNYTISFTRYHDAHGKFLGSQDVGTVASGRYTSDGEEENQAL